MSSFGIFLIGFVILAVGIVFAASLVGLSQNWMIVLGLVLVGLGVVVGVAKTRRRDPASPT